jgi:pimeloyl-ACP methyl ester carboxylesterase
VAGTSVGGFVAMTYATRHPEHPARLVLISTSARLRPSERHLDAFERRGGPAAREAARRRLFEDPTPEILAEYRRLCLPLYVRHPDPQALARVLRNPAVLDAFLAGERYRFDLRAALTRVTCPTLVLGGLDDPIILPEETEEVVAALTNASVHYRAFPDAGHGVLADAGDEALRVIRDFVQSEPNGPGRSS